MMFFIITTIAFAVCGLYQQISENRRLAGMAKSVEGENL